MQWRSLTKHKKVSVAIEVKMELDVEMIGAKSKTKKKSCKVCGSNAMSNLQYGAIVCAGCRAFSRRIVVSQNEPKLCLYDYGANQRCEVTGKKRSICPYCRFQKCLEMGMLRDRVIGDGINKVKKSDIGNVQL